MYVVPCWYLHELNWWFHVHLCLAFVFETVETYFDLPHLQSTSYAKDSMAFDLDIELRKFEKRWRFTKDIPNDDGTLEHCLNTISLLENCPVLFQEQLLASTVQLDTAQVSVKKATL